uniref:BCAR3 adaptor protein, NSP family member n=1 Tax=Gadus morhua TaxID=8049 RepID=A0A8C5C0P1_GADMO
MYVFSQNLLLCACMCVCMCVCMYVWVQFSRDQFIMDGGPPEKLRRELEEELKTNSEEPRSHAWYHGSIPRQVAENLVQRDGDFLVRDSLSSPGCYVLTSQWRNTAQHFKINKKVVMLNEAYSRVQYSVEREGFDSVPALIRYYVGNRKPVSQVVGAIVFQPINRGLPLRCLEEKYGLATNPQEARLTLPEKRNLWVGLVCDNKVGPDPIILNNPDCCSQSLFDVSILMTDHVLLFLSNICVPILCHSAMRHQAHASPLVMSAGQTIRGSDSQLCPRPPPKPSKVSSLRQARGPCLLPPAGLSPSTPREHSPGLPSVADDEGRGKSRGEGLACIGDGSEEEGSGRKRRRARGKGGFQRPLVETASTFRPSEFCSRLLPAENKPLEMVVLRRSKELVLRHDHRSIARHMLAADCQVARILDVSSEVEGQMGVASGLELVTLPHGQQLRLDLMERHHTLAIGVAVDILGCTGSVEERASTLNRIIQVSLELKDSVGDLYAFTALMKALDLPQISRLEHTWTALRRSYTQTAITYEKSLKPFYQSLYEGTASLPPVVSVPVLLPLLTLMERPAVSPEGLELWETSDQGCDIMLRHLEAARGMAHHAHRYTQHALRALEGFQCDEDLLEVFKTDFQQRLLWGSRGATVNQSDRYSKFTLILTALSRKLEPPPTTHTQI